VTVTVTVAVIVGEGVLVTCVGLGLMPVGGVNGVSDGTGTGCVSVGDGGIVLVMVGLGVLVGEGLGVLVEVGLGVLVGGFGVLVGGFGVLVGVSHISSACAGMVNANANQISTHTIISTATIVTILFFVPSLMLPSLH
jgi:hypothetical protein